MPEGKPPTGPGTPRATVASAWAARDHNSTPRADESLADDLNKERGIVRGRVALLPRSAEIQPWFWRFVARAQQPSLGAAPGPLPLLSRSLGALPLSPLLRASLARGRSRGGESAISAQGSAQATAQTHPALPEPPLGAPAVPSGLNAASGAGGASV